MFKKGIFIPKSICLFAGDEGGQGGGGGKPDIPDASADLKARLAQAEGSAMVVAQQLANDIYRIRINERNKEDEVDRLKIQITDLKGKIPAEGSVVLTKEQAEVFNAITALGKPEEIKAKLDKLPDLESKVAAQEKTTLLHKVADSAGYDRDVFVGIEGIGALEYEFKAVDGKDLAHVKDGDKLTPVTEWVEANKPKFMDALKPKQATATTKHVKQDVSGKAPTANVYDKIREREKAEQDKRIEEEKARRERSQYARA